MTVTLTATAQDSYKAMLRDQIAPALRALGFTGSGAKYKMVTPEHTLVLSFQRSKWSTAMNVSFAVNLSATPTVPYPGSYLDGWTARLGGTMPARTDIWWDVPVGADTTAVAGVVLAAVRDYGLPAMLASLAR